jgi:hypothetical protein
VTTSVNNGSGRVHLFLEHPRMPLADCAALECAYPNLPITATALIAPEGSIGTEPGFGGDCAGTVIAPCRLRMDHDRTATIILQRLGLTRHRGSSGHTEEIAEPGRETGSLRSACEGAHGVRTRCRCRIRGNR